MMWPCTSTGEQTLQWTKHSGLKNVGLPGKRVSKSLPGRSSDPGRCNEACELPAKPSEMCHPENCRSKLLCTVWPEIITFSGECLTPPVLTPFMYCVTRNHYIFWWVPNTPSANPWVAERAPWRSSQKWCCKGPQPIGNSHKLISCPLHIRHPLSDPNSLSRRWFLSASRGLAPGSLGTRQILNSVMHRIIFSLQECSNVMQYKQEEGSA